MPQAWQQGSAARKPSYDQTNPFAPINYAQRLQNAGKASSAQVQQTYQPGQLYGQPPVSSAPPSAAPQFAPPSYMPVQPSVPAQQQPAFYPESVAPGAPYPAQGFAQQAPARMPSSSEVEAFAAQQADEIAAFFAQPWYDETPEQQPVQQEEPVLKDAFEPAATGENKAKQQTAAEPEEMERPRIRVGRLIALTAAIAMLVFCCVALGRILWDLFRSEQIFEEARTSYQAQTGMDLRMAGARVDLLPAGQTYAPTTTPVPTQFIPTPSPTPIFAIREAAVMSLAGAYGAQTQEAPSPTDALRTRLTIYPKNPMCNVSESLKSLLNTNPDVIGHLVIDGVLDQIIVQRNNTYYLTHDAYGMNSASGAIFADESCSLRMPPENLLLRGQGSVPGKAFEPLWQYVSKGGGFVASAATATLTTLYEEEKYVLFAVIEADSDPTSSRYFNYASHPTFATDEAMLAYVNTARRQSLYPFNTDVAASDRLLTLATVGGDSSVVLMYRMVRDGEAY